MSTAARDEVRQTYLDQRGMLIKEEYESAHRFDKILVTLSSGALGLSITFIKQMVPDNIPAKAKAALYLAWAGFICALLSILLGYLTSQAGMRKQRAILDNSYKTGESAKHKKNTPATLTKWLSWVSLAFFIIGVVCLAIFSYKNLPG